MGLSHGKSDSESGFDESSSQMSRSGIEENAFMSSMVRSPSSDNLSEDMLRAEVKTVACEWKSLRNVMTCSCATPFDYYVKKVSAHFLFPPFSPSPCPHALFVCV